MDVERKLYIGVVEDNNDPRRQGRIKVRVQTLYHTIPVEDIPWAAPFASLAGKSYEVPAVGKLVNVLFFQNNLYDPYYVFSENYNINLQNKLKDLSDDEYINFVAILFDERTQISADSEEFTIDHLFNKMTINSSSINHELKDNSSKLNLGKKNAEQEAVLGTRFFTWMDEFMTELSTPSSLIGNLGAPILKPKLEQIIRKYFQSRDRFVSKHVKIVDNNKINNLERTPETDNRKNDVDLIISDTDENTKILNAKIQAANDDACKKSQSAAPTSYAEMDGTMSLPLIGNRISSRFGLRKDPTDPTKTQGHGGIDIAASTGTPIISPGDGTVLAAGFDSVYGGGNFIRIKHTNGFTTGYAHLSQILVQKNEKVKKDQKIGLVGNTGAHTTGPHLHFTVTTPNGSKVDPELYFNWPHSTSNIASNNSQFQGQDYQIQNNNDVPCDQKIDSEKDNSTESPLAIAESDIAPVLEGTFYDKVFKYIIKYEGFISESKWDVNSYRVGYGSDTITRDGKVHKVQASGPYSKTNKEEAKIDLIRRVKTEFEKKLIDQIGGEEIYNQIPDNVKIALISNVYNYGSLLGKDRESRTKLIKEINNAIKNKNWKNVGNKLLEITYNHNAGKSYQDVLRKRRYDEAVLISKGGNSEHLV